MRSGSFIVGSKVVVPFVELAEGPVERMRGLLGRDSLEAGHAMWIPNCRLIHTFGMRFDLDLYFLDSEMLVVEHCRKVGPYRMVYGGGKARSVVEMMSGWMTVDEIGVGDRLSFNA